jgi:hypothetical protein
MGPGSNNEYFKHLYFPFEADPLGMSRGQGLRKTQMILEKRMKLARAWRMKEAKRFPVNS